MKSEPAAAITSFGTIGAFLRGRACSDTLFHVVNRSYGRSCPGEEKAASLFAGGMIRHGYQCGMIWGSALAAGAEAFRRFGPGPEAETRTIMAAQRVLQAFKRLTGQINCMEITGLDVKSSSMQQVVYFLLKGGTVGCLRMSARFAPIARAEIDTALSEPAGKPEEPASCAAMMARALGGTPEQATMAAGLAGGIGLSGGACGALGTMIWLAGLRQTAGGKTLEFKNEEALAAIGRFLKITDYRFECSEITGYGFSSPAEHAKFLRGGGCKRIISGF